MPANWTEPITWAVDQLVTNSDLNEQLRDNLLYLLSPNHERIVRDNSGSYSITNVTTFQDIDGTNLSIDLTTHGGPVWLHLQASVNTGGTVHESFYDFAVDGVRVADGYAAGLGQYNNDACAPLSIGVLLPLAAGTYTFRPQWCTGSGDTATMRAGTANCPVIFEAIEL